MKLTEGLVDGLRTTAPCRAPLMQGREARPEAHRDEKRRGAIVPAFEWEAHGDRLRRQGDRDGAARAYLDSAIAAGADAILVEAAMAIERGDLPGAEHRLRSVLRNRPTSIAAIRLMALLALKVGRHEEAVTLLSRALDLAPDYIPAREMRARTLQRMNRFDEAMADAADLRLADPANPSFAMLKAALLVRLGHQQAAADLYRETLDHYPDSVAGWLSYGHVLKAIGHLSDAVSAYRRALHLRGDCGEAWWSLANLKTFAFTASDIAAMDEAVEGAATDEDRLHLHFALGKAHEDGGRPPQAFAHYAAGNGLRHAQLDYQAGEVTAHVDRLVHHLAGAAYRAPAKAEAPEGPIFVVGLPRSGSTLVEQILASHPAIEGTSELPDMMMIAERLSRRADQQEIALPTLIAGLSVDERLALGQVYLRGAALHRHDDKPFFIDKMPNNWKHVVLIKAILPEARIIDVRRHPMAVGWSAFKQHFSRGQEFTYDLADLGQYYRDYVRLLAAFDAAAPGHVHRIHYEELVPAMEHHVRAMLAFIGLPFDETCLRFWANDRVVRTPSSEQVRRPLFTDALDHWRQYEPWLQPLRDALGNSEAVYKNCLSKHK